MPAGAVQNETGNDLRNDAMMAHLLDTLDNGQTIQHYGRLVLAMVGRFFLTEEELVKTLAKDPECSGEQARELVAQVSAKDYNPPHRNRILEWMRRQEFPICPDGADPDACNVYKDLQFPREVYDKIQSYYEGKGSAPEDRARE